MEPSSKFIKVRCTKCKNEQIIFGKASTEVLCLVCGKVIATPGGGKTKIKVKVVEVLP
ncbi:MAG TPA: 30S ribosomal protein S27e [Candidatus Nanoarchaeia archaeon]|nr:30S ribosomal protein S27e [Candidatus Nanoarchaeia archaeon]